MKLKKIISLLLASSVCISGMVAKADTVAPFAEVDFSTLTSGFEYDTAYTSVEMTELYSNNIKSYGSSGIYKLINEDAGTSLAVYPSAANTGGSVVMTLPEAITHGRLEIDMNVKMLGTSKLARHLLFPQNSKGSARYTIGYANSFYMNASNKDTANSKDIFEPSPDEKGFYHLACIITAPDSASDWTYEVYDKRNLSKGPFYRQSISRTYVSSARQDLSEIASIYLVGNWATSSTYGDGTNGIEFTKATVYKGEAPRLVSVGEYDEMAKSVSLTFDKAVAVDDAVAEISPAATATISHGITEKEVVLTFADGLSADGEYSVNLSGIGYKDSDYGYSYDFTFEGFASGAGIIKSIDYNAYTVKSYTKAELEELNSDCSYTNAGVYEICDMSNGKNGLKISTTSTTYGGGAVINFGEQIKAGRIQIDSDIKMENGEGSVKGLTRNLFRPRGGSSYTPYTVYYRNAGDGFARTNQHNNTSGAFSSTIKPKKTDGVYKLSCVLTAENENSDWTYELYDRSVSLTEPFYTMTIPRVVNNTITNTKGTLAYVDSINLTDVWYVNGDTEEDYIQLSGVKVYKTAIGAISKTGELDNDSNSVEVIFNTPMQVGENTKITATDENSDEFFARIAQGNSQRKATISFPWGIPSSGTISVKIENMNYYGSDFGISTDFELADAVRDAKYIYNTNFTDKDGNVVSNLDDISELNFTFDSIGITGKTLYMVSYKDKQMQEVVSCTIKETDNNINIALNGADEVKFFVWGDNVAPELKTVRLSCTEDGESGFVPLSIQGGFYTEDNNTAVCIRGNDALYAKARIVAGDPPENLGASVKLVRGGISQTIATQAITFSENIANVSIDIDTTTLAEGDALEFVIANQEKEYFTKTLYYDDPKYTIDILMVAGQSNALGQYADKTLSIKPEEGTVYYNTMGDTTLSTSGDIGWSGALGKTWHERTGHTVLVVKAAWGGTGFEPKATSYGLWSPDATEEELAECYSPRHCYAEAKEKYNKAVASVENYLSSGYKVGNCVYFWMQGENENSTYTAKQYADAFLEMHNGFKTEFGTESTRLEMGGILPVRKSSSPQNISTSLAVTGPRAAQAYLANTREDIIMVTTATENWYSNDSIKAWFEAKYPDGSYTYGDMPVCIDDVWRGDYVHYNQLVHNEFGFEAADAMLDYLEESKECTGISIIGEAGIKHYEDGAEIVLPQTTVVPVINSPSGARTATYTLSGNAADMTEYNEITAKAACQNDYSTMTVTLDNGKTMSFKLYSPIVDESISIASVKDNKTAIYTLTTDDGYRNTNEYLDGKFEELGLVGTMGLVVNWLGNDGKLSVADAQTLVANGRWGVANHTLNHKQGGFQNNTLTEEELELEVDGAREKLLEYFPSEKVVGMYTPGGGWSTEIVNKVKENHIILRRAGGGGNSLPITTDAMLNLQARAVGANWNSTADTMNEWVDTAIANGQWLCEMWHGIGDDAASWGGSISEETADAHLGYIKEKKDEGKLWVATLDEAGIYSYQRAKTVINKIFETDTEIKFTLRDELDDKIFDAELTVNVTLPKGWTEASVKNGTTVLDSTLKDGVLSFNAPCSVAEFVITKLN